MSESASTAEGAAVCRRCGACCRVEGYVRLRAKDVEAIAAHLGLSVDAFTCRYTRLTDDRRGLSLTEKPDGSCIFLESDNTCRIQAAKPDQCRSFPMEWRFDGYETICEAAKASRATAPADLTSREPGSMTT